MTDNYNGAYIPEENEFFIEEVKDRWNLEEKDGKPKKIRTAYASWGHSIYNGAIFKKDDLERLRDWCSYQLEHFDDKEKETVLWDQK